MTQAFNRDCMEAMREFPDKFFDLAIVDPPYGIGNWVQTSGNIRGNAVDWNNAIPPISYFDELKRVSKDQIIWGANYYNTFNGRGGAIIWNKGVPRETNLSVCEIASYSRLARVDYVDLKWQNINRKENTIHPCQKPIDLYKWKKAITPERMAEARAEIERTGWKPNAKTIAKIADQLEQLEKRIKTSGCR